MFIKKSISVAKKVITNTIKYLYNNLEGVIILILASIGCTAIISELPFIITMPLWIESSMVIPILSISIISLLVYTIEYREGATNG